MLLAGLYLLLQFITLFYQRPFSHSLYIFSTLQYTKAGDTLRIVPGDWRFHLCAHFMDQGYSLMQLLRFYSYVLDLFQL